MVTYVFAEYSSVLVEYSSKKLGYPVPGGGGPGFGIRMIEARTCATS